MLIKSTSPIDLFNGDNVRRDLNAKTPSFFCNSDNLVLDHKLIENLKEFSARENDDVRLCLHHSPDSTFHDMIILQRSDGGYRAPHRHDRKGETWHLIEGKMAAFAFSPSGKITDFCVLGDNQNFLFRVGPEMIHTAVPLSNTVIFHEGKPGPFTGKDDSVYPDWAPSSDDQETGLIFQKNLLSGVGL